MLPSLDELLTRWQEAPELSAEELCKEVPELLPELRQRIAILQRIQQLAELDAAVPYVFILSSRDVKPIPLP